jgi:hypothetical protein
MTEEEKQAIRASFAGKRVSQMTEIERKVFDEDFQYGVRTQSGHHHPTATPFTRRGLPASALVVLKRLGLVRK